MGGAELEPRPAAEGGVGLRDLERRRLPGEYDLDLDLDLERERLLEERDRLRLLDLEREEERDRDRDREREEDLEDLEDRELERDEERPRLLDRLCDLEGPLQGNATVRTAVNSNHMPQWQPHETSTAHLFLFSWPLRRRARILARKNS